MKSAISSAVSSQTNTLSMRGNLGEVLRAKGDLEEAVVVLRAVIQEEEEAGIRDHQVCFLGQCAPKHPGTVSFSCGCCRPNA